MIQLTGAGVVAGAAATGSVSAASTENVLSIRSTADTPAMYYEFSVDGSVQRGDSAEDNDGIEESGGVSTVTGQVGPRGSDSFTVPNKLNDWSAVDADGNAVDESRFGLYWNDQEVALEDVLASQDDLNVLSIRSTADTPAMYYEFSVDGSIQKGDDAEDSDTVETANGVSTVAGQVGPRGTDSFHVPAKLNDWSAVDADGNSVDESRFGLYWNDQEVALDDILVDGTDEETDQQQETYTLGVHSNADTPAMTFEFTVDGEAQKGDDTEDNDTVEQSDGVSTVTGNVGPRGSDSFTVPNKLNDWSAVDENGRYVDESRFDLTWDGDEATLEDVLQGGKPTRRLEIVTGENVDLEYTFEAGGEIAKVYDNGDNSAEDYNDEVSENGDGTWTAEGFTGQGFGDTYDFQGGALDFQPLRGEFALYLDGEQITPWDLIGEEEPTDSGGSGNVDGGPMGGGQGYEATVARDQADVVVSTQGELDDALSSASSGDVVYVSGSASIDIGSNTYTVPRGVTLASNRGIDDAPGGHIHTDEESTMFNVRPNARVTGVRIQGPYYEYFNPSWYATGTGMDIGDGVEVDNCEIWGFAYAGINAESGEPHIHHNHVHHTPRDGLGYGIIGTGGHPLIEWNYCNYNRHAVASSGNGGYTVRYNRFGPDTIDIVLDVHRPGGTLTEIYNNTIEGYKEIPSGDIRPGFQMRGVPDDVAEIYNNWFYNPYEPRDSPTGGWTDEAIIQVHVDEWTNVEFWNNHYGQSEPSSDIGHPR